VVSPFEFRKFNPLLARVSSCARSKWPKRFCLESGSGKIEYGNAWDRAVFKTSIGNPNRVSLNSGDEAADYSWFFCND
jgi:hypothetical protein